MYLRQQPKRSNHLAVEQRRGAAHRSGSGRDGPVDTSPFRTMPSPVCAHERLSESHFTSGYLQHVAASSEVHASPLQSSWALELSTPLLAPLASLVELPHFAASIEEHAA